MSNESPKFYQNGFFHVWILLILGLLAGFTVGILLIAALVLLLGEIIFDLQQKIYSKNEGVYNISKYWMAAIVIISAILLVLGFCRIGGMF